MIHLLLTVVPKPSDEERGHIVRAVQQLASTIGPVRCEREMMSQVVLLAESKAKERKAVSAHTCGVLSAYVSPVRCRALMEALKGVRRLWSDTV